MKQADPKKKYIFICNSYSFAFRGKIPRKSFFVSLFFTITCKLEKISSSEKMIQKILKPFTKTYIFVEKKVKNNDNMSNLCKIDEAHSQSYPSPSPLRIIWSGMSPRLDYDSVLSPSCGTGWLPGKFFQVRPRGFGTTHQGPNQVEFLTWIIIIKFLKAEQYIPF